MENKSNLLIYNSGDYLKLIAKLKWFYNDQTNDEEGYLSSDELSDIYFRSTSVKGVSPFELVKGEQLVVEIPARSLEYETKIKARRICRLEDEIDLKFLLYESLIKNNQSVYDSALKQSKIQENDINKEDFSNYIISFLSRDLKNINEAIFIFNFCANAGINLLDDTTNKVRKDFDSDDQFKFWTQTSASFPFEEIKPSILDSILKTKAYELVNKLFITEKEIILNEAVDRFLNDKRTNTEIAEVLNQFYINNIEFDFDKLSDNQVLYLWSNDFIKHSPINVIFRKLEVLSESYNEGEKHKEEIKSIFSKATHQELKDLFSKIHFEKNKIKTNHDFGLSKLFIDEVLDDNLRQNFFSLIYSKSSDYLKLLWFVEDYTDEITFYDVVIYTGLLSNKSQKVFFKKVLMLIATNQIQLSIIDLKKITTIDYQTSEYAKDVDGIGLDFTLNIILKIIEDLSQNKITNKNTLFDIIAGQIKRPDDLLVINGFFEKCDGRTIIEEEKENQMINDSSNPRTTYNFKKIDRTPRFSIFCDGRKAINKSTGSASLCQKSNFEFWWCENSKCFEPCRKLHQPKDWRSYTLEDVLKILNIPYNQTQYEIVLNVVNRVNRFLKHLTCCNCKSILKPKGKGNYAFYGVTRFGCDNSECSTPDKDVYLSHCLNGKCEGIIDSRETVKCKPSSKEHDNDCGWYICQNCFGCCSTKKINGRKYILEQTGQTYNCHDHGHKDLGIICCPKCGTETEAIKNNKKLYKAQLNWFIDQVGSSAIISSGQRPKDNKWWFRWNRGDLDKETFLNSLQGLKSNGFHIPDIDTGLDIQFISEPFDEINEEPTNFKCPSCQFRLDLKIDDSWEYDYKRLDTIKSYHNKIFKPREYKVK